MPSAAAPTHTISVLRNRIQKLVADHFANIERCTLAWYDNLASKYGTTLSELDTARNAAVTCLTDHLKRLNHE